MRSTLRLLLLTLGGALSAAPVAAQSAGTVELGAFGKWTRFGNPLATDVINHLPRDNGFGFGGRLGIFVVRRLEIEADASYTKVDAAVTSGTGKVSHFPFHIGPTYNLRLGEHASFLLGARYVHNKYGDAADFSDHGFGGLVGFRFGPVRIDGTGDWMSNDGPGHGSYHNLGVDAGLSLLLGNKHCRKDEDGVTVTPASVTLERGQRATFTGTALHCGKPREVTWSASGGDITESGEYTAGRTPGNYLVTATEPKSGLSATAAVVINEPPPPPPPLPPPPPAITVTRIDLRPDHARAKVHEPVAFTVTAVMSDGSNRPLDRCPLTATGNATQDGNSFSWGRYGNYTVTANCEGQSDQSTVEVPLEIVIYGANFRFNKDQLTPAGMDSVRVAADSLKLYPEIRVRLGGFADFVGTDAYNCGLTWRRVQTVHRALNQFGIGDDRISAIEGFGHAYPIPDDQVPQAWKDINTRTHDKGKWWDRRVGITSASKDPAMTACQEPASPVRKRP